MRGVAQMDDGVHSENKVNQKAMAKEAVAISEDGGPRFLIVVGAIEDVES